MTPPTRFVAKTTQRNNLITHPQLVVIGDPIHEPEELLHAQGLLLSMQRWRRYTQRSEYGLDDGRDPGSGVKQLCLVYTTEGISWRRMHADAPFSPTDLLSRTSPVRSCARSAKNY